MNLLEINWFSELIYHKKLSDFHLSLNHQLKYHALKLITQKTLLLSLSWLSLCLYWTNSLKIDFAGGKSVEHWRSSVPSLGSWREHGNLPQPVKYLLQVHKTHLWIQFDGLTISSLLFADDLVFLVPSGGDLLLSLERLWGRFTSMLKTCCYTQLRFSLRTAILTLPSRIFC